MAKSISTSESSESGRKRQDEGSCESSYSGCLHTQTLGTGRKTSRREKGERHRKRCLAAAAKEDPHRTELSRQKNLRGSIQIAPLFSEKGFFKKAICSNCLHYFHRIISIGKSTTSITKLQDFHSFPHFFIQSSILKCQTDNNSYHAYCHRSLSTAFKEIASWGPDKSLITQVARKGGGAGISAF